MKTTRCSLFTAFIAVLALSIAGCFEIEEKYTFHKDGSATMAFEFAMGEQLLKLGANQGKDPVQETRTKFEEGKKKIEATENVRSVELIDQKEGNGHRIGFKMVFNDMTKIQETLKEIDAVMNDKGDKDKPADAGADAAAAKDANKITVSRDGDTIKFRRLVEVGAGNKQDNEPPNEQMKQMMSAAFAGKEYVIRLYTDNVVQTNGQFNEKEGCIEWKKPMFDMMDAKAPWELTATIGPAGSGSGMMMWIIIGGVAVVALVVVIVVIAVSKGKKAAA